MNVKSKLENFASEEACFEIRTFREKLFLKTGVTGVSKALYFWVQGANYNTPVKCYQNNHGNNLRVEDQKRLKGRCAEPNFFQTQGPSFTDLKKFCTRRYK